MRLGKAVELWKGCDKLRLGLVSLGGLGGVCHGEMRLGMDWQGGHGVERFTLDMVCLGTAVNFKRRSK